MEDQSREKIIYYLNVEDVQTVATQEIERELSNAEIAKIKDSIAENIPWYDAIANAILKNIGRKE
jgi:hypothetical protein